MSCPQLQEGKSESILSERENIEATSTLYARVCQLFVIASAFFIERLPVLSLISQSRVWNWLCVRRPWPRQHWSYVVARSRVHVHKTFAFLVHDLALTLPLKICHWYLCTWLNHKYVHYVDLSLFTRFILYCIPRGYGIAFEYDQERLSTIKVNQLYVLYASCTWTQQQHALCASVCVNVFFLFQLDNTLVVSGRWGRSDTFSSKKVPSVRCQLMITILTRLRVVSALILLYSNSDK